MKKKVLAGLLAAMMSLCLWPAGAALADGETSVKIGSVTLNATTPYYVNGTNGAQGTVHSTEPAAWNARLENGTLDLNGLNISVTGSSINSQYYAVLYANGDLAIALTGDSFITNTATAAVTSASAVSGIYCTGGLTVGGDGTLRCTGGPVNNTDGSSCGVYTTGGITVESGALTGIGDTTGSIFFDHGKSCGVYTGGAITVKGGTLTGQGGQAKCDQGSSCGVYATGGITVEGGALTGRGGPSGMAHSYGIYTKHNVEILSGGALVGTGGSASDGGGSYGAFCGLDDARRNIQVKPGGALTLKGLTKVLYNDTCNLISDAGAQYKYRTSQNMPAIFTLSSTAIYEHNSSYQYVQILPVAHPEPPTGVTLVPAAPKEGVTIAALIAPPAALEINDTIKAVPSYQWYANNTPAATGGTPISGATGQSYCPTSADVGKYLYVTAHTYDHFESVSAFTAAPVAQATAARFISLTANGSDTASTTELTLTFNNDIEGFEAGDVTLSGATKGALTNIGRGTYTLGVSDIIVADGGNVTATVSKAGFVFTPDSKTAAVRVHAAPTPSGGGSTSPQTVQSLNGAVRLTGAGLSASDMLIVEPLEPGAAYNVMLQLAEGGDIFAVYDLSLASGTKSTGSPMTLQFNVGAQYAGQTFTLVHRKADGAVEYLYAIVNANGILAFGPLYELSPFMLVKGALEQVAVPAQRALDVPQTGDPATATGYMLMVLAGLAFGTVQRRKHISEDEFKKGVETTLRSITTNVPMRH